MIKPRDILGVLLLAAIAVSAGCMDCTRRGYGDVREDQPWVGPGERAQAFITVCHDMWGNGDQWEEWTDGRGRAVVGNSERLVEQCDTWLRHAGERTDVDGDLSQVKLVPASELPHSRYAVHSPRGDGDYVRVISPIWTIVCLRPVVLVEGPGLIRYRGTAMVSLDGIPLKAGEKFNVLLGLGFSHGTQLPYSESPRWFSPDMKGPPRVAEYVDETHRRILVSWGWLVLTREGGLWQVTAEGGS